MNIHSNVKKDNSKIVLFIGISIALMIAAFAYHKMVSSTINISAPMQTNGLSKPDQIKQKIREAESLRDAYTSARDAAAQARDWDKSAEQATKVEEQKALIKKLYDDLHEANMKEGENGETK